MDIDLSKFVPLAKHFAALGLPTLENIASDAAPFPFGGLTRVAIEGVAAALGINAADPQAPEHIAAAIDADPAAAKAVLQPLETSSAEAVARINAEVEDRANARAMQSNLSQSGSRLAWGPAVISAAVILMCIGIIGLLAYVPHATESGTLASWSETLKFAFVAVISFWVGSSQGSNTKTHMLNEKGAPTIQANAGSRVTTQGVVQK